MTTHTTGDEVNKLLIRQSEICQRVMRQIEIQKPVPSEWLDELNEINKILAST